MNTPAVVAYDYSLFGEVEVRPLSRIRQVIGARLSASWATVPHVAQFDEVDLTPVETLRHTLAAQAAPGAPKLTLLPFVMKACALALRAFPEFNAALDVSGKQLILKKYCHIGFAVDTPVGLLAPVVRHVDAKSLPEVAAAIAALGSKARSGQLALSDAEGGCFTVSNLGTLGGTGFIPVVNAPEIAILGMARAARRLVEVDGQFVARPMLPLCLVYDHRVIDGVVGARFMAQLRASLARPESLLETFPVLAPAAPAPASGSAAVAGAPGPCTVPVQCVAGSAG
jgi:pyruvate dehydrogenase E2 component (dihydrolipoamide acetyltransferase)